MKKKELIYSEDIVSDLKKVVAKNMEEKITFSPELYDRLVNEAVLIIQHSWKSDVKSRNKEAKTGDVFEAVAYRAFFVTDDLKLYSEDGHRKVNPNTGKSCFFDVLVFPSEAEKEQYVKDVISRLPEGTLCEVNHPIDFCFGMCETYTFKLKVTMD